MKQQPRRRHRRWKARKEKRTAWVLRRINELTLEYADVRLVDNFFRPDPFFERMRASHNTQLAHAEAVDVRQSLVFADEIEPLTGE